MLDNCNYSYMIHEASQFVYSIIRQPNKATFTTSQFQLSWNLAHAHRHDTAPYLTRQFLDFGRIFAHNAHFGTKFWAARGWVGSPNWFNFDHISADLEHAAKNDFSRANHDTRIGSTFSRDFRTVSSNLFHKRKILKFSYENFNRSLLSTQLENVQNLFAKDSLRRI